MQPVCPICKQLATKQKTRYGIRHTCCGIWSWGNYPLVDEATHVARRKAHEAFDPIWKNGHLKRGEAYERLSKILGISRKECHMKLMDRVVAEKVPDAVKVILKDLANSY